jgi:hypothetical protein
MLHLEEHLLPGDGIAATCHFSLSGIFARQEAREAHESRDMFA